MANELPVAERRRGRRDFWRVFAAGLGTRLAGVGLIWLGDSHDSFVRKGMVVGGVVLSVGGIGVLKYLLYGWPRKKRRAVPAATT